MASYAVIIAALLGVIFGSFCNVVIYRLPRILEQEWQEDIRRHQHDLAGHNEAFVSEQALSLSLPRSHCPHCLTPIRWRDLIPVLSWLLLRGSCHFCHQKIPFRYVLVELASASLAMFAVVHYGLSWEALAAYGFLTCLLVCALVDADSQWLPDRLTQPLLWAGLLLASLNTNPLGLDLQTAVWGCMAGYMSFWLLAAGFKLFTGKDGLGGGDIKLLAALGAWLGAMALPMLLLLASVIGLLIALWYRLRKHQHGAFPFGPALAAAGAVIFCQMAQIG